MNGVEVMLFLFLEVKKRIMSAVKALLALAIMVILAMQLLGVIQDATDYYRRWMNRNNPHGNPLKVFKEIDDQVLNGDDRLLKKIKKYKTNGNPE